MNISKINNPEEGHNFVSILQREGQARS